MEGPGQESSDQEEGLRLWADQLLERYGVFFRDLLTRESGAPPWRMLLPVYRRMEAKGEIRGGRFITGVSGEQFALPEVVPLLRQSAQEKSKEELCILSASDPMNLAGIVTPGAKVTASASNAVAYLGGKVVGHRQGKEGWVDPNLDEIMMSKISQSLRRASE